MKFTETESAIEAILFAAGDSVTLEELAEALEQDEMTTRRIIQAFQDKLAAENRGIQIIEINGSYLMCTNKAYYSHVSTLYKGPQKKQLSQSLVETLSIIAYKQPVTKTQIEEIRGVDASHAVNKLVEYGLVCERGRLDAPGRPILFGTTEEFLKYYGFNSLSAMPQADAL